MSKRTFWCIWSFGVFAQACLLLETDAQVRDVAHGLLVLRLG